MSRTILSNVMPNSINKSKVEPIKRIIKQKCFKPKDLKLLELKDYCRWKKQPGDDPLPTKKADLIREFNNTRNKSSHNNSPCSSEVKDDGNDDDVDSLDSDASAPDNSDLEFGSDAKEEESETGEERESASENDSEEEEMVIEKEESGSEKTSA